MEIKEIKLNGGAYQSQWGLTDFYPQAEETLRKAIESGEDFTTDWACKKEIRYARIARKPDWQGERKLELAVTACMDDLWDGDGLIYDAPWETREVEEGLPEGLIALIKFTAQEESLEDNHTAYKTLPADSDFDTVCQWIRYLEEEAEEENKQHFDWLCSVVRDHYDWWKENMEED